jgi:hypothetical protein
MGSNCVRFGNYGRKALFRVIRPILSDEGYATWTLRTRFGHGDLRNPKTFNEKLQWLKLYYRVPALKCLADKLNVREYVRDRVGERYLNKLYGVYERPEEIDFDALPDAFVIKATHGSSMNILVEAKRQLNIGATRRMVGKWLRENYYDRGREWVYRDIPPRVICELFLRDSVGRVPYDFKFFCFNGRPRYIQVDIDRFAHHRRVFYDTDWNRMPFGLLYSMPEDQVALPSCFEEMLWIACKLSCGIPFVRVDLYAAVRPVFGEMTFYPGNGSEIFQPSEWDLRLGDLLDLPKAFGEG